MDTDRARSPPPSKANLKAWWKQFKAVQKAKRALSTSPPGRSRAPTSSVPHGAVFGAPLRESLRYANVPISTAGGSGGMLYIYGYVPVVVAKCGLYLKETATEVEGTFRVNGSAKRMRELQQEFETPPKYGKNIDWKKSIYTTHDVASVFRRYLTQMPEPVIPHSLYFKFRDAYAQQPFNHDRVIKTFQSLIKGMPRSNQYLLLYVLDLLSVFARKSSKNLMTTTNLAVIFRPGILSHPEQELSPTEHKLSQEVVEFLIDQQDLFLLDIPPPPRNDSILDPTPSARIRGSTGMGSPLVPEDEYFMMPSSEGEGEADGHGAPKGGWKLVESKPNDTKPQMTANGNSSDVVLSFDDNGAGKNGATGLSVKRSLTVPSRRSDKTGSTGSSGKLQRKGRASVDLRELSPGNGSGLSGSSPSSASDVKRSGSMLSRGRKG